MAVDIKIPVLTGDYKKDRKLFERYMQEVNLKIRLLEGQLRKEIKNEQKGI